MRNTVFVTLWVAPVLSMALAACGPSQPATLSALPFNGNVDRGFLYAQQTCARCHAVGEQRLSPDPRAPSFDAIANTPGMTGTALNAWLHTSHPTMPNFILDPGRIEDLSAYIASLKRARLPQ